jgi:asparagine synthase (glutamine-hydrolysing)
MCGIVGIFDLKTPAQEMRVCALDMAKKIRHRGPDWSGIYVSDKAVLAHERLAIVDPISGGQPLYSADGTVVLAVNGEIYNHRELKKEFEGSYAFKTESDCEVIIPLYQKYGADFIDKLTGMFAFALYDIAQDTYLISRDHMGIIPLYEGTDKAGNYYVASELKSLEGVCNVIEVFLPGHYKLGKSDLVKWYDRDWMQYDAVKDNPASKEELRAALEKSVKTHLMSDVPYGVLLSGGLDSSLTAAIAKMYASKRIESEDKSEAWYPTLHSFAIGLDGSPDLAASRKVADQIGTVHHEVTFTVQEGLDAIKDVIYHLETYDITTIRASTPMYLLSRVIKSMGIKMVLSGEGADEIFGGYLYFHKAPNAKAFHEETVRKLSTLYLYDCLRANKSLAAWGVEGRVPFLDKEFMDVAMRLNPEAKMCGNGKIEKHILRETFEDYLPHEVAWRQKEQFSDGVGYNWIDSLKELVDETVTDVEMEAVSHRFPINPPATKEEYYYRTIFEEHFPSDASASTVPSVPSIACSTPVALEWDASFKNQNEPSGRAIKMIHDDSY